MWCSVREDTAIPEKYGVGDLSFEEIIASQREPEFWGEFASDPGWIAFVGRKR